MCGKTNTHHFETDSSAFVKVQNTIRALDRVGMKAE